MGAKKARKANGRSNGYGSRSAPEWAQFLGTEGYEWFIRQVEQYFAGRQQLVTVTDDGVIFLPGPDDQQHSFGLLNLAQTCARLEASEWPEVIARHFDTAQQSWSELDRMKTAAQDFDQVCDQLRVRLFPADVAQASAPLLYRPALPDTIEVLVYDLPSSIQSVRPADARQWGLAEEELFRIGRRNVQQTSQVQVIEQSLDRGAVVLVLLGDEFYTASRALMLDPYLPADAQHGALVGVPTRALVFLHIIRDITVIEAINSLLLGTLRAYQDGPGSLSPYLYWYRNGEYVTLPARPVGDQLEFTPPAEFMELITLLTADRAD